MKFPLSLDLRKATLESHPGPGVEVMDANYKHVLTVYPDAGGTYENAGKIVDVLNAAFMDRK